MQDRGRPPAHPAARRIWTAAYVAVLLAIAATTAIRFLLPAHRDAALWTAIVLWGRMISWSVPGLRTATALPIMLIVGPFLTRDSRFYTSSQAERLDALPAGLHLQTIQSFGAYRTSLEREGFRSAGLFRMYGFYGKIHQPPGPGMLVDCYEHPVRRLGAVLMFPLVRPPSAGPSAWLRFDDLLPDETWVVTTNTPTASAFPRNPKHRSISLPRINDVRELLAIHSSMLHRFAPGHNPAHPAPRGWIARILDENQRSIADWRRRGIIVPTSNPGEHRLTLWRACSVAWGQTRPIVGIRRILQRRRHERLRVSLGL